MHAAHAPLRRSPGPTSGRRAANTAQEQRAPPASAPRRTSRCAAPAIPPPADAPRPLPPRPRRARPAPQGGDDESLDEQAGANYQIEMMRCLREVNVDNNTVGWYQSSSFGSYQTTEMIETFVSYHESIRKCVCLVYDPQRSARGQLALKAVRLKDSFIDHFKEQKLTGE